MTKLAVLLFLGASSAWCQAPAIDWDKEKAEMLNRFQSLIRIDTSSPPGNETRAVEYLRKVLEAEGIPTKTLALDPNRANLVARLKGNGSRKPLLILAHTDVVAVQREKWPVDPFGAVLKDGHIWGRGSRDDKPNLAANLMVMLLLKRSGVQLDRDVIFLAESGEEADTTGVGINFMVAKHFDDIDAEFAMTEGGGGMLEGSRVRTVTFQTAEKLPARVRLVATGTSGHGSIPRIDNALISLGAAVAKAGRWETPIRLNDTTRTYFEKLAGLSPPDKAARYNALLNPATAMDAARYLAANEPELNSMLRASVVPTMMKAGIGANVIPSEAEATLDIRLVPGEDQAKFNQMLAAVIADPAVKIVPLPATRPPSPPSRLDTEMYRDLEKVSLRMFPGAVVMPEMNTGSTDMAQLRNKGIQCYGIGPLTSEDDKAHGLHSDVEWIQESSFYKFVEFTWNAVVEVSAHR